MILLLEKFHILNHSTLLLRKVARNILRGTGNAFDIIQNSLHLHVALFGIGKHCLDVLNSLQQLNFIGLTELLPINFTI